jgi:hypothetical protein
MKIHTATLVIPALLALAFASCSSPQGRIMGEGEEDYVGAKKAGAATWDRLIEQTVNKVLANLSASNQGVAKLKVGFMGVENAGREALGDAKEQIFEKIDTSINTSRRYETISDRFIRAGLRDTGLRTDQLFIPRHMRAFAGALESMGAPVEGLLFAKVTTMKTRGEGVSQVNYMLTLELVDIATGRNEKESVQLRKAYQ